MMKTLMNIVVVAILGLAFGAAPALAAQLSPGSAPSANADTTVQLVHGCHRGVQRDHGGWHYQGRACQRIGTPPPGLYDRPYNRRYYRGPVCRYQCRYVGPVKTCQQVCRR
jgi:hypothetical protein